MLTTILLSALLMLGGLRGKSVHSDKHFLSSNDGRHTARQPPHKLTENEIRRSLALESFNIHVAPTTSKFSLPTIIRLYPPTAKPLHMHANMPMRFGRGNDPSDDKAPHSTPNMPQRFGRAMEASRICAKCPDVREAPNAFLPQRFGRNIPHMSLRRTLSNRQLLGIGLHWDEDFEFAASSEEVEMEEKTFNK
ncbi:pro-FMRFamide-related neuropeptide VF [Mastacembelus armatus]|uniref:Neuropeptide VF precursor n=1 Tax=Mastacembelus armatus TaxID=205130 RepID=A0A3Q3LP89_9TELE|nr:pro-FMRFamide-related neuropeptide VF-like [Mastacembelus armatus]